MLPPKARVIWSPLSEYILGISPSITVENKTNPVFDFKVILSQTKILNLCNF